MSREVLHELNGLLAAQVDAFAVALEQRDQARQIAVQLEAECNFLRLVLLRVSEELEPWRSRGVCIDMALARIEGAFAQLAASVGATTEVQP